ncbi:hypothetical protein [Flavobacterium sp.]|uniref:hypothetical protein n=1 Tax=Flavobacterium sp. TaxID=239 RepID=UPI003C3A5112
MDLRVHPKGHVKPEIVAIDLPKAIRNIKKSESNYSMITTSIENINSHFAIQQ